MSVKYQRTLSDESSVWCAESHKPDMSLVCETLERGFLENASCESASVTIKTSKSPKITEDC